MTDRAATSTTTSATSTLPSQRSRRPVAHRSWTGRLVAPAPAFEPLGRPGVPPVVEVVIPIHDEAAVLAAHVRRVHDYVREALPFRCLVTIADNASTDASAEIGALLAAELEDVRYLRLEEKGRGRALRAAWSRSRADVVAYMDVDLSTDLSALAPLVAPLVSGHSAVAIGTRLAKDSRVVRGPKRELISRTYNRILRTVLRVGFSDAQCGFKAIRSDVAAVLLPLVEDQEWFFDTELLVLAERSGLRIHEVPVDWVDDPDSRVDIVATAWADLRGIHRIRRRRAIVLVPQPAPSSAPLRVGKAA
jgi:glycosyltransferase involved in cell wall biosynthesis